MTESKPESISLDKIENLSAFIVNDTDAFASDNEMILQTASDNKFLFRGNQTEIWKEFNEAVNCDICWKDLKSMNFTTCSQHISNSIMKFHHNLLKYMKFTDSNINMCFSSSKNNTLIITSHNFYENSIFEPNTLQINLSDKELVHVLYRNDVRSYYPQKDDCNIADYIRMSCDIIIWSYPQYGLIVIFHFPINDTPKIYTCAWNWYITFQDIIVKNNKMRVLKEYLIIPTNIETKCATRKVLLIDLISTKLSQLLMICENSYIMFDELCKETTIQYKYPLCVRIQHLISVTHNKILEDISFPKISSQHDIVSDWTLSSYVGMIDEKDNIYQTKMGIAIHLSFIRHCKKKLTVEQLLQLLQIDLRITIAQFVILECCFNENGYPKELLTILIEIYNQIIW